MNQEELERKKLMNRIVANDFAELNGAIMRTIGTVFKSRWFKVADLLVAFHGRTEDEVLESMNYLEKAGYLEARDADSKTKVEIQYTEPDETEAILTARGIRLVKYFEVDDAVRM